MFAIFKAGCLVIYAAALAQWAGLLSAAAFPYAGLIALALLMVHAVEIPFLVRLLRLHQGPLWVSVVLNLLFGLLHWVPLKKAADAAAAASRA